MLGNSRGIPRNSIQNQYVRFTFYDQPKTSCSCGQVQSNVDIYTINVESVQTINKGDSNVLTIFFFFVFASVWGFF
mgnify:FL=1